MKIVIFLLMFITLIMGDTTLKIATYNVENLFDLGNDTTRYPEYISNGPSEWNDKNYKIKLKNISQVIKDIDADIIGLQEIGSLEALKDLRFALKQRGLYYQYYQIADSKNTSVKVAILSKIPFLYSKEISVTSSNTHRNILETKFKIGQKELYVYVNHWKSKRGPESMRILYAKTLMERIKQIGYDKNVIVLGDFNSDYEEYIKFTRKRELNDTDGITGINHILGTIKQTKRASETIYEEGSFYNLWYDTDDESRYSYLFKGKRETPDNILVSQSLLKKKDIYYKNDTITNFYRDYLFKKKIVQRWEISRGKVKKHRGIGYSDHLPITADFIVKN